LQKLADATSSRVVCFELPGFGFSYPKQGFTFAFNQSVDIMTSFLNRLGIGPYVLLFSCVSGLVALKLAQTQPDLIRGLVLSQCSSYSEEKKWAWRMDIKGLISSKFIGQVLMVLGKNFMTRKWFNLASGSQPAAKSFTDQSIQCNNHGATFCLSSALQEMFYNAKSDPLQNVSLDQPALILWGCKDRSHKPTDRKAILQHFNSKNTEYKEYNGIGHFPDLEQEDEFIKQVTEFLEKAVNRGTVSKL
jgi:pimeloyl-ACP methyl ester carboxylesterase